MQITRQADYATRAILHLARVGADERVPTGQIAKEEHISPSFLTKIVAQLSVAGLLRTSRGAHGGVTLARQPQNITLLEVIEAIDGPIQINLCAGPGGACSFEGNCPIRPVWCEAQDEFVARLRNITFAQLIA